MEKVFVFIGTSAGYLDTTKGNSYCHNVYRKFSKFMNNENAEQTDLSKMSEVCPIQKEEIENILLSGKVIVNVFQDIYNGQKTQQEWWEYGTLMGNDWVKIEKPATDGKWYEWHLYENHMRRLSKLIHNDAA